MCVCGGGGVVVRVLGLGRGGAKAEPWSNPGQPGPALTLPPDLYGPCPRPCAAATQVVVDEEDAAESDDDEPQQQKGGAAAAPGAGGGAMMNFAFQKGAVGRGPRLEGGGGVGEEAGWVWGLGPSWMEGIRCGGGGGDG